MLSCIALSCIALARPSPRSGRQKRAIDVPDGPAPLWEYRDAEWEHKDLPAADGKARQSGGRSRAARREAFYGTLRDYSEHFGPLIQSEFDEEQRALREQLAEWPAQKLMKEGWLLTRLSAKALPDFYASPRLQLSVAGGSPSARRAPLPFHRFVAGDM
eukprot:910781-Prymnesium_polylepis.2